ncbi:MAG: glycosyltransferase [Paludibacter sp.]|jgi:glycosyltransferase involved in cell wall biosynthesis|nr:glycosyltransferase [Paludibacter sp.]
MLSILIPTYNYNVTLLVKQLHSQAMALLIDFEIIIIEDGSNKFLAENVAISNLENVKYTVLQKNIGRSAIRNLLADTAKFNSLLFIDCDAEVANDYFLKQYLPFCSEKCVAVGGTAYNENEKNPAFSLRLKYGRQREAVIQNFSTFNFLISKDLFQSIRFDETLKTYGYEDTLFGHQLTEIAANIYFINNKLIHNGLDENYIFLQKAENGLKNLIKLYNSGNYLYLKNYSKILNFFLKIKKYHLQKIISFFFKISKPLLIKNLTGKNPSLLLFDIYKLGVICQIK